MSLVHMMQSLWPDATASIPESVLSLLGVSTVKLLDMAVLKNTSAIVSNISLALKSEFCMVVVVKILMWGCWVVEDLSLWSFKIQRKRYHASKKSKRCRLCLKVSMYKCMRFKLWTKSFLIRWRLQLRIRLSHTVLLCGVKEKFPKRIVSNLQQ